MLTQERLKEILHYDPDTGVFTKNIRVDKRNRVWGGFVMEYINTTTGYSRITIDGKRYQAHRLAWLYMTGNFPKNHIDHINGIRNDNKFCNLRDVTRSENMQNQKRATSKSVSGFIGANFDKRTNRYYSTIKVNKKRIYIGVYETAKQASDAYIQAKRIYHKTCTI